ncbi:MAG: hypothetical protein HRU09_16320 [Oligoflexales bacterium]|nr:hypothetical protein [Oligoflexales bacterium]
MKSKVLLSGLMFYATSALTSAQARPVEICFNTLTVYQSQPDLGNHEEWRLNLSVLQPWGEERLGRVKEIKVPEKLSNARWTTGINRCYRTDVDWNNRIVIKISGKELDSPGDDRLPTATQELNFGYRNIAYANGYGHAYSVSVSLRELY